MYSVKHNYFKTFLITKGTTEDIGIIVCKIMVSAIIITSFLNIWRSLVIQNTNLFYPNDVGAQIN